MDFSLIKILSQLNPIEITVLVIAGTLAFYFFITKQLHIIIFMVVLSASLVGTTIPIIENIASLSRWLSILLLLMTGVLQAKFRISLGVFLFLGYIGCGFISLFRANNIYWQLQRAVLMLLVAIALSIAYSHQIYQVFKLSLISVSLVAIIFSLLNFVPLLSQLGEASRYSGVFQKAPMFVISLGSLLPFTFWGLWGGKNKYYRIACGIALLLGMVTLIFSGQRTGTLAGFIALIPMLFLISRRKNISWVVILLVPLLLLGYELIHQSSAERIGFLLSRYSLHEGLSNRESIWRFAISEIAENPFLGRGIGAAETVFISSFHNAYLEIWYNTGIIGLFMFLTSQFYFFYRIFYLSQMLKDPEIKFFLMLALGYMLGFVATCVVESVGAGASNLSMILYLFFGILVSSSQFADSTQLANTKSPSLQYGMV